MQKLYDSQIFLKFVDIFTICHLKNFCCPSTCEYVWMNIFQIFTRNMERFLQSNIDSYYILHNDFRLKLDARLGQEESSISSDFRTGTWDSEVLYPCSQNSFQYLGIILCQKYSDWLETPFTRCIRNFRYYTHIAQTAQRESNIYIIA